MSLVGGGSKSWGICACGLGGGMGCSLEAAWRAGEGLEEDGHALRGPHHKNPSANGPPLGLFLAALPWRQEAE